MREQKKRARIKLTLSICVENPEVVKLSMAAPSAKDEDLLVDDAGRVPGPRRWGFAPRLDLLPLPRLDVQSVGVVEVLPLVSKAAVAPNNVELVAKKARRVRAARGRNILGSLAVHGNMVAARRGDAVLLNRLQPRERNSIEDVHVVKAV